MAGLACCCTLHSNVINVLSHEITHGQSVPGGRNRIAARELERHNRLYYVDAKLEIPDREYDALMTKLMRWRLLIRNFIRRAAPA